MATCSAQYFDSALTYIKTRTDDIASFEAMLRAEKISYSFAQSTRVEFCHYNALLAIGATQLQQPLLGFYLGQDIKSADYGELGYLAETCQTLSQAIDALLEYESIVADFAKTTLTLSEQHAKVTWTPDEKCHKQVSLRNITAWVAITRLMVAQPLKLDALCLTDSFPLAEQQILANWFGCPVTTSAKHTQVIFPRTYLSLKLVSANENINHIFNRVSQQALDQLLSHQSLAQHIAHTLKASHDLSNITQANIAQQLHVSVRTLQRKLHKENSNFFTLVDQERKYRAISNIGQVPLYKLAQICGFSEQSALNKAFKRWFCCSPSIYLTNKIKHDKQ